MQNTVSAGLRAALVAFSTNMGLKSSHIIFNLQVLWSYSFTTATNLQNP